jgi:dihydrofolate reductase
VRTLVVTENITADGVIDMAGGWFDPLADGTDQSDLAAATAEHSAAADAVLLGRVTFEAFRGFWPNVEDDPTGVRDYLNAVDKYVVSQTIDDPQWDHTTVLRGAIAEEVAALKAGEGRDIVATGSVRLVHELLRLQLVDELRLFVFPVVVGSGARLFDAAPEMMLELLETRPFVSGAVLVRYAVRPPAPGPSS